MNENEYNLPGLLDSSVAPGYWDEILKRLRFSGSAQDAGSSNKKSYSVQGGIGYTHPIGDSNLSLDVNGNLARSGETVAGNHMQSSNLGVNARLGYDFPLDSTGRMSLGLLADYIKNSASSSGGAHKSSHSGIRGVDAAYQNGANTFGASYQRQPTMGDIINLFYERRF